MKTEIITIGDEILIGQILDSNSAWIAKQLNSIGISVYQISSVSDSKQHIISALNEALQRAAIVLITGGLGPTKDDLTKQTLCEYFNTKLIFHQPTYNDIKEFVKTRKTVMNKLNKDQALIPEVCTPLRNRRGTAPGMWFEKDGKIIVSMPGVPFEMKDIMTTGVLPELQKRFKTNSIIHKTVLVKGMPEAVLAEKIQDWEDNLPSNIKLAYLPSPGIIRLRFSAENKDRHIIQNQIDNEILKLEEIIPKNLAGFDTDKIEEAVGILLKNKSFTISTAESCTGGTIAHLLTAVPNISNYYKGSVVAYSNSIKINILDVSKKNIEEYGAVSEQVVKDMVLGVKNKFQSHFAIATSGIAGPSGGTDDKPIGTTWIAVSGPNRTIANKYNFIGEREQIILKASRVALALLQDEILISL